MTAFVALIELQEQLIAAVGEDAALRLAQKQADRTASVALPTGVLRDVTDQRENFPRTGRPPMRCYRFTYRTENPA